VHGKVLTVSADSISRDKPSGQSGDKTNASGGRSSESWGQELAYAARISLKETGMQIVSKLDKLIVLGPARRRWWRIEAEQDRRGHRYDRDT
jgi:hypothetical protein